MGEFPPILEEAYVSKSKNICSPFLGLWDFQVLAGPAGEKETPNCKLCCCLLYFCCIHSGDFFDDAYWDCFLLFYWWVCVSVGSVLS